MASKGVVAGGGYRIYTRDRSRDACLKYLVVLPSIDHGIDFEYGRVSSKPVVGLRCGHNRRGNSLFGTMIPYSIKN